MQAWASDSLQGAVSADGRYSGVIYGARNGVEDDVKNHQKDDPADSSIASICAVHGKTSFSSLISVSS